MRGVYTTRPITGDRPALREADRLKVGEFAVRMLHPVRPEEKLICRGEYRYTIDDQPTGDVELFQITHLPDGTEVVRADIDGRVGPYEASLITHHLRRPNGRPAWLRARYQQGEIYAAAQYVFQEAAVQVVRQTIGGHPRQENIEIASGYQIDYHPVVNHDFAWRGYPADARPDARLLPIFSPDLWTPEEAPFVGRALRVSVAPLDPETITTSAGTFENVPRFSIRFSDDTEIIAWYDKRGIPLRWYAPSKGYDFVLTAYHRP